MDADHLILHTGLIPELRRARVCSTSAGTAQQNPWTTLLASINYTFSLYSPCSLSLVHQRPANYICIPTTDTLYKNPIHTNKMRSQIFALGLAGVAAAAYAPEAPSYGQETTPAAAPAYGAATTPEAPTYESTSSTSEAPVYESTSTPMAPGYGWESTSSESTPVSPETTSAPAYSMPTGYGSDTTVTDVISEYTTYCPEATTLTHGGMTYTVSTATTLTITSCPGGCSQSAAVPTMAPTTSAAVPYSPVETSAMSAPVYGPGSSSATWATSVAGAVPYYPTGSSNATMPAGTGSPSAPASQPASYTGAASNVAAGAMVGFSGLIAALFL